MMSVQKMKYWFLVLWILGSLGSLSLHGAERNFTVRYTTNDTGDIAFIGNTLMTLTAVDAATITSVQTGAATGNAANNNTYFMDYVKMGEGGGHLDNSSAAVMNLPSGSTILWAGLYWGANTQLPSGSKSYGGVTYSPSINTSTAKANEIQFKVPGGSYQKLTATISDDVGLAGDVTNYGRPYSSFVDVTSLVRAAGNGTYSAGQVLAARGINRYAVWTLVVVYKNLSLTPKNLTVFDGFKIIGAAVGTPGVSGGSTVSTLDIPISGFNAPATGPVNVKLGVMSYEGDVGYTGDALKIGPTTSSLKDVADAVNLSTNFANSTISYLGHHSGPGDPGYPISPAYKNQLGVDSDIMAAPTGAVLNNGTNAVVRFTTNQDAYYPAVLTTAVDLYAPQVVAQKDFLDVNGDNVTPGDVITYTIKFKNRPESELNGDATRDTVLTDILPEQVTYVPGSLKVVRVGQTTPVSLSDAGDSDDGEVTNVTVGGVARQKIVVRLGHPYSPPNHSGGGSPGGVGTSGGVVKQGEEAIITFDVKVKIGTADGVEIINEADIGYNSLAKGIAFVASVVPATVNNSKVISGVVFEDVQYGGGAGRGPLQVAGPAGTLTHPAGAKPIPGARVELYGPQSASPGDTSKTLLDATTTGADGSYIFRNINNTAPGNLTKDYVIRVVSGTVGSTRGSAAGLVPVQTYRTETELSTSPDGDVSTVVAVLNRVGGENPGVADAPANMTIGTPLPADAQNVAPLKVTGADLLRVDFGFNFDTVVNTNDLGQGSLRQAIINANALSNSGLAQIGLTAGIENIIFMIPNGSATPGLRDSLNYFSTAGTVSAAKISVATPLPAITQPLVINATRQPGYTASPVVWVDGAGAGTPANGFEVSAAGQGSSLIGLSITGFSGSGISVNGGGSNQIKGNFIGLDPSRAAAGNAKSGILVTNASGNTIGGVNTGDPNVIAHNGSAGGGGGIVIVSGGTNAIRRNSIFQNKGLGIDLYALGVNANDGAKTGVANSGIDYPIITSVTPNGANLNIVGYIGKPPATGNATFGGAAVELFLVNDDGDQNGESVLGDGLSVPHGEGETYLTTITAAGNGTFTATIPALSTSGAKLTATATDSSGNTSEFGANVPAGASAAIKGTVFEDPAYPGGAGRPLSTAGTVGVVGATVELYNSAQTLVTSTVTVADGAYTFTDVAAGTYTVRVVGATVPSSRPGYLTGLLPVQTFRTDGQSGTLVDVTDYVGGEDPAKDDTAIGVYANTGSAVSQSVTQLVVAETDIVGVDFGFNFNTVVNVRDDGRGSLRQFIRNANALNGADTAIFMISNGTSGGSGITSGGLRSGLNYFAGGVAPIALTTSLPAITEQVTISGSNQPGYSSIPVVEVSGAGGAVDGFSVTGGTATIIDSLVLNRFSGTAVTLGGGGSHKVTGNRIGTNAAGSSASANGRGVVINNAPGNTIGGSVAGAGNTISGNTAHGIVISGAGATGNLVKGNQIGLDAAGTSALGNGGSGILFDTGASQNSVGGAGVGESNRIAYNSASGIVVLTPAIGNTFQQNAIWSNTGPGIDLGGDGVTPNNGTYGAGANGGMNYPVFSASLSGSTLRLVGFIGSAAGQASFGGSRIELYRANNTPADQNGGIIAGDGLSVPHGEGQIYLGSISADSGTGIFDASISVSGLGMGDYITAIATHGSSGSSSEFSANVRIGAPVRGFVYLDANRDNTKNDGEVGTNLSLFAKLVADGGSSAAHVVPVNPTTGAYEFPGVTPGTWAIVISTDDDPAHIVASYPSGWTGTEFADGRRHPVVVNNHPLENLNFGLVPFMQLTGRVFADTGIGTGGIANDGARNGAEKGVADVVVKLTSGDGSTVYSTATTATDGAFTLLIENTIPAGTTLKIVKINPASYLSTGATVGNTAGTYTREEDTLTFTYAENIVYSGIELGIVPLPKFETEGQQAGLPGTAVYYPHIFTAGSAGSVVFSTASEASPALEGWVESFHLDTNGNGVFDAGEPIITGPLTVAAGEVVHILVKEFIPIAAPNEARNKVTVSAEFTYTGAPAPALTSTLTRTDVTFVGNHVGSGLVLSKSVDKTTALPGENLVYTLKFTNKSAEPLSTIIIYDVTPEFTTFVESEWTTPLPNHISEIVAVTPEVGKSGALKWTLTGSLLPGAAGEITFTVKVSP